jgi:hypothetical protein
MNKGRGVRLEHPILGSQAATDPLLHFAALRAEMSLTVSLQNDKRI